ncbi:MAG: ABC transporter permease [Clostridiales bacterium]|jgi:ABC-type transport system involved in multi-copper enzyme maturation permease subunit|nr:ABC transporter permease [Clostridiales bacterium]
MKKFFDKIAKIRFNFKMRSAGKKKRFGRKRHFDMERLLRGEFYKFFKGVTFKISLILLVLSMVATVFIYGADGTLMDLARSLLSSDLDADVFTVMDGIDSDFLSLAGEFEVDIPTEALSFITDNFGDEAKVRFLSTAPKDYYAALNPARFLDIAELQKLYSDEMIEFILTDRNFLKLMFNSDAIYRAVQDFSTGKSNALTDDLIKFLEDNRYFVELIGSVMNLYTIIENSPVTDNINAKFEDLKKLNISAVPDDNYTVLSFYTEFFGAMLTYGQEVTLLNVNSVIYYCYEQTRMHTVYNVPAATFFAETAPGPNAMIMFGRDIYNSGIIGAVVNADSGSFAFFDFMLNAAVMFAGPYSMSAAEEALYLPDDYDSMPAGQEKDEAYAQAVKQAKFQAVKEYVFTYLRAEYPGFYSYADTLPLFDVKTLKKLVPDIRLQAEIRAKSAEIVDTYIEMFAAAAQDAAMSGSTDELMEFLMYFAIVGDLHDIIYDTYTARMLDLKDGLLRMKKILDFFSVGGGKSAQDFIEAEIINLGNDFESLLALVNEQGALSGEEYLEALTDGMELFAARYTDLHTYIRSSAGTISFSYFPSKNATTEPEKYDFYDRQYNNFVRSYRSVSGIVVNPSKSESVKIESIRRFAAGLTSGTEGFFSDMGKNDMTIEQKMAVFLSVTADCYTADIDEEFFETNYRLIYGEMLTAFKSYLSVYKDKDFFDDELYVLFDAETAALLAEYYINGDLSSYSYAEFRDMSRSFTRRASLILDYVPKVYLNEVLIQQNLNDKALGSIYGMISMMGMGTTKYSVKSDIQKDLFYFKSFEMYGSLTGAMSLDNGYGYMNFGISFMSLFIVLIALVIASGTIAGEYETGSIKLLLIRPYRRYKVLTAKLLFVALSLFVMFLFAYLSLMLMGQVGTSGWSENWAGLASRDVLVIMNAENAVIMSPFSIITYEFLFFYINCLMYSFIAVMVSTIFKSRAASVAVSVFVFFASTILTALLSNYSWYKFIIFNNTDFFVYLASGPSLADMSMGFSAVIYIAYMIVILGSAYWIFEKRDAV